MHDVRLREIAKRQHAAGRSGASIARRLGVPHSTVCRWISQPVPARWQVRCWRCDRDRPTESRAAAYSYLLGHYLGDGYLARAGRVHRLTISCAATYPDIAHEVDDAIRVVSGNRAGAVQRAGCTDRGSYWKHWPCVLPQHGPGRKHERPIVLADWQHTITRAHPWPLIRGLIQSDGCRAINAVTVRGRRYRYVRYFFANESTDILAIMGTALDLVGVQWRHNRPNSISIARRDSVALMERHVGPKR